MNILQFIDREEEISLLARAKELSKKKLFVIVIYGLRRVGKTRLLLEFIGENGIYLFANRNKTSEDLLEEYQEILRRRGVITELETINTWDTFFEVLATRITPPIVFDEFQNFAFVEKSVFGILQKTIDLYEDRPGLIILSGSLIGIMKNLFLNRKEPLYGRVKQRIRINPLSLQSCLQIGSIFGMSTENLIKLYCIFGGYPKYYVAIEDFALQRKSAESIIEFLLFARNAPLEDEVTSILSQEFGNRHGIYYSILGAIAEGNNTISSIAGALNTTTSSITRQVSELRYYFELIELELPFEGKRGIYRIRHPLLEYWFAEIFPHYSDYTIKNKEYIARAMANLNTWLGRAFERVAKEFLVEKLGLHRAQRQWGRIRTGEKGRDTYEIDLLAKAGSENFAFAFKWAKLSKKSALGLLETLATKLEYLPTPLKDAKLGVVAKRITGKDYLRNAGFLAYDLNDFSLQNH